MAEVEEPPTPETPRDPDTLTSVTALARFEFEFGRGGDGSKVLMVEWQDEDVSRQHADLASWQISWQGKHTVFPTDDNPTDNIRRVYYLLPPTSTIPSHVTLAFQATPKSEPLKMAIKPLPAIFTQELGASAKVTGRRGVLHTIWAKKRLNVLDKEIKHEQGSNLEGIALEMACSEKTWIETNFGLQSKPSTLDLSNLPRSLTGPTSPGLQSPKSPTRLSAKLRGLSIGTSDKDLMSRGNMPDQHPLSPENTDIAYSSFDSFPQRSSSSKKSTAKRVVPPESVRKQQGNSDGVFSSVATQPESTENDLFAVAMSPRTPGAPKSPFSLSNAEVGAFSKIKGDR